MRATIKDVAAAAGVSRSTASRALSGSGYAAPEVRERVRSAARELGYVVDTTARSLKQRTSRSIGVIVSDLRNTFYAELASGIGVEARETRRPIVLVDLNATNEAELKAAEALVSSRVSGVIATPVSDRLAPFLSRLHMPLVEVDRRFDPQGTDAVVVDNRAAARKLTERLLALGHRNVALLIDELEWTTGKERASGFQDALVGYRQPRDHSANRVRADEATVVAAGWDVDAATAAATSLLTSLTPPTAIFAANNVLTEGVWRAAQTCGLRVPGDLSIVGFDDAPWMSMVQPGISTCRQDTQTLGAVAVRTLVDRIENPTAPVNTVVLPTEFVDRGSLAPPGS